MCSSTTPTRGRCASQSSSWVRDDPVCVAEVVPPGRPEGFAALTVPLSGSVIAARSWPRIGARGSRVVSEAPYPTAAPREERDAPPSADFRQTPRRPSSKSGSPGSAPRSTWLGARWVVEQRASLITNGALARGISQSVRRGNRISERVVDRRAFVATSTGSLCSTARAGP
jgi:hypothetical protein